MNGLSSTLFNSIIYEYSSQPFSHFSGQSKNQELDQTAETAGRKTYFNGQETVL